MERENEQTIIENEYEHSYGHRLAVKFFDWCGLILLSFLDTLCKKCNIGFRPSSLFIHEEVAVNVDNPEIDEIEYNRKKVEVLTSLGTEFNNRHKSYLQRLLYRDKVRQERLDEIDGHRCDIANKSERKAIKAGEVPFQDVTDDDYEAPSYKKGTAPLPPDGVIQAKLEIPSAHNQLYKLDVTYKLPSIELLQSNTVTHSLNPGELENNKRILQATLDSFAIDAHVCGSTVGPRVTLFEVETAPGVKVESIAQISGNITMDLCSESLRILAPIPGRPYVGIEAPNKKSSIVGLKEMYEAGLLDNSTAAIPLLLGKDISGKDIILDLAKAPHLLIAGATGSGKSVCLNSMLMSLLYRFTPEDLRLILVDPKVVEFSGFAKLPHLIVPVITETSKVVSALRWVVKEMEERYKTLAKVKARNLESFNSRYYPEEGQYDDNGELIPAKFPRIVVVIDELADIMMTVRQEVETYLARIAQLSRAVGIHLIVATQRPSVNVITGIIKANFPTRIAFQVSSLFDSRTILDCKGAESLLGSGDMLYKSPGAAEMLRIQSPYVSDEELEAVVDFVTGQADQKFNLGVFESDSSDVSIPGMPKDADSRDEVLITQAIEIIVQDRKASTSYIQRRLRIGYNRAATIIEELEKRGIVGPMVGTSARREILID